MCCVSLVVVLVVCMLSLLMMHLPHNPHPPPPLQQHPHPTPTPPHQASKQAMQRAVEALQRQLMQGEEERSKLKKELSEMAVKAVAAEKVRGGAGSRGFVRGEEYIVRGERGVL